MNYELAKQLKDAGFPDSKLWNDTGKEMLDDVEYEGRETPTLEELIEATPQLKRIFRAGINNDFWRAESDDPQVFESGSTPTEALAKLWLALNKK